MNDISVKSLGLSVRALNVLERMGIKTLYQLQETPLEEIAKQRNAGNTTIKEIKKILSNSETGEFLSKIKNNNFSFDVNNLNEIDTDSISIKDLGLSVRAINVLERMNINTLKELILTPMSEIFAQRNIGVKTINEISSLLSNISEKILTSDLPILSDKLIPNKLTDDQLLELSNHRIDELNLSTRPYNALFNSGYVTLDKIFSLKTEDLNGIESIGNKSKNEIVNKVKSWLQNKLLHLNDDNSILEVTEKEKVYWQKLADLLKPIYTISWSELYILAKEDFLYKDLIKDNYEDITKDNIFALLSLDFIKNKIIDYIKRVTSDDIMKLNILVAELKKLKLGFDYNYLLDSLLLNNLIELDEGYCFLKRNRFIDYFNSKEWNDSDIYDIALQMRISGESLQSIGNKIGRSRERARQIFKLLDKKLPKFYEDYYKQIYETFIFEPDDFVEAFPKCSKEGFGLLSIRYDSGKIELTKKNVADYNGPFKEKLVYFAEIKHNRNEKRKLSRTDIVLRILMSKNESISVDELEKEYNEYVNNEICNTKKLIMNIRSITNFLRNQKHFVFDRNNKVRFIDIDYDYFWSNIDLTIYNNMVVSSELIYKDNIDLMDELDIRDGYELFYIIKTSLDLCKKNIHIYPRRVPVTVFGEAKEEEQALELLKEKSPIDYYNYYIAYEERYGLRRDSAMGNPLISNIVKPYFITGKYVYELDSLSKIDKNDEVELKKTLQIKNIWFLDELKSVFKQICVNSSADSFNYATFYKVGYILLARCAFINKYDSLVSCLENVIFSKNIIDLSLYKRFSCLGSYNTLLDKKKKSLEYIEIALGILMKLDYFEKEYSISIDEIAEFQQRILKNCNEEYFNANSIWDKIKNDETVLKMRENRWLCTCLIRQQDGIYSKSFSSSIILSKKPNSLNTSKICEWIMSKYGKMSLNNLVAKFNELFDSNMPQYRIAVKLKSDNLWDKIVTDPMDDYINTIINNTEINSDDDLLLEDFT